MKIERITTPEKLLGLERDWNKLLRKSKSDSVFLTWEWMLACCEVVNWHLQLLVIVVRDNDGTVIGIAPLYIKRYYILGILPFDVLQLIPDNVKGSEYLDFIVDEDVDDCVYTLIIEELLSMKNKWHCIWIHKTCRKTDTVNRIKKALTSLRVRFKTRQLDFAAIPLPKNFDDYLSRLSKRSRATFRQDIRRARSERKLEFDVCESDEDVLYYLEQLFNLHHERWQLKDQIGSFKKAPREETFYRIFAPIAFKNGWLHVTSLRGPDGIEAIQYGYVYNDVYSALQEGFSPQSSRGVGNALRFASIQNLIANQIRLYDFLGHYSPHKKRWRADKIPGDSLIAYNARLLSSLVSLAGIWPTGRFVRNQRLFSNKFCRHTQ